MKEGGRGVGRAWNLYKMGGIPPAIASMFGAPGAQQIAFIRQAAREQRKQRVLDQPLTELETVVFDLETTGFHPENGDEILSIGGVRMRGPELDETRPFYRVVNPRRRVPRHIVELTGITNEMAEQGEDLVQALSDFLAFVGRRVLIAHASGHDKRFLGAALWRTSKVRLTHRVLDTMMVARWLEPNRVSYGLDELLESNGVPITRRHHALEDAIMTAKLWQRYLRRIAARNIVTLGDLYAYLSRH